MVMAERKTWMLGGSRGARSRRPSCARAGRGACSHRLVPSPVAAFSHRRGLRPGAGTAYYYRIRAYNDIGYGEPSDVASATTSWTPTALNPPMDHLAMAVAKRSDGHVVPGEFYAYDYDGIGNRGLMRNGQAFVAIYRRGAKKPG